MKTSTVHFLLATSFLLFFNSLFSQNHYIGVKAGVNWTNVNSKDFYFKNTESRFGFNSAFTYEYFANRNFTLGVDLLFAQKGFRNDLLFTDDQGFSTKEKWVWQFNYDYFSLPLKAGFVVGKKILGFTNVGIVSSFLYSSRTIVPAYNDLIDKTSLDVTKSVNSFDIGGLVELGGSVRIQERFLVSLSMNYQHSFTSFTNSNYYSNANAKHNGIFLSIGLKYALRYRTYSPMPISPI